MIGPLVSAAVQAALDVREALFSAARARVQRFMIQNVRCPYCEGTGQDAETAGPCIHCLGTGLRQDHHP